MGASPEAHFSFWEFGIAGKIAAVGKAMGGSKGDLELAKRNAKDHNSVMYLFDF